MRRMTSNPGAGGGPCWECHYFESWFGGGSYVLCGKPKAPPPGVQAAPATGCAFWEREARQRRWRRLGRRTSRLRELGRSGRPTGRAD
jgi:hypothetical protein